MLNIRDLLYFIYYVYEKTWVVGKVPVGAQGQTLGFSLGQVLVCVLLFFSARLGVGWLGPEDRRRSPKIAYGERASEQERERERKRKRKRETVWR